MISRLLLGLGSFSNSMLYTFIFIFFTYQLIEPQLIYTIFSEYATALLYFWKYLRSKKEPADCFHSPAGSESTYI